MVTAVHQQSLVSVIFGPRIEINVGKHLPAMLYFPTAVHQWSLAEVVIIGPSSNRNESGNLQAIKEVPGKQSHSLGITCCNRPIGSTSLCYREAFFRRHVRNIGSQRKGDEGSSCHFRNRMVHDRQIKLDALVYLGSDQDKSSTRLEFQGLLPKASRKHRRFSRHSRLRSYP